MSLNVPRDSVPSKSRGGGARIVGNDHPDAPASIVLLRSIAKGHLQMTYWMIRPPGLKFAPDLPLIERILNTKFQLKQTNGSGDRAK